MLAFSELRDKYTYENEIFIKKSYISDIVFQREDISFENNQKAAPEQKISSLHRPWRKCDVRRDFLRDDVGRVPRRSFVIGAAG